MKDEGSLVCQTVRILCRVVMNFHGSSLLLGLFQRALAVSVFCSCYVNSKTLSYCLLVCREAKAVANNAEQIAFGSVEDAKLRM